jgi:HSP20 family protein
MTVTKSKSKKGEKIMAKPKEAQETTQPTHSQPQGQVPQRMQSRSGQQAHGQDGLQRRDFFPPSLSSAWGASPFSLMNRFAEEMDRLFDNFGFGRSQLAPRGRGEMEQSLWSPQLEVFERDGQMIVRADLPGLGKDDVKVNIEDNALTIQGERRQEHEENREGWRHSERSYGSFYRSIPLPEGVDAENAKANFRDGVLEITMPAPKREERRGRQIEIT